MRVYEYTITYFDADTGRLVDDVLEATDDGHAVEEASYECHGQVLRVARGELAWDDDG